VAVIGETLWIHGKSFGRQPTVTIAGRPATVWSRTGDGGILVRVPVGAAAGTVTVAVKQEYGTAEATLTVRRYAGVLAGGRLTWLDVSGPAPVLAGEAEVPDARFLRMSPDGRAAYVVGPRGLGIWEMTAPGKPEGHAPGNFGPAPIVAVAGGASANLLVVVREADLALFDLSSPLRPQEPRQLSRLPPAVRAGRVVRAELSPDGRHLACALAEGNRVVLVDLGRLPSGDAAIVADLALAPEARAPVLADLAFAHDGRTLWVVAGDTAESKPLGPQPTRVFALRIKDGPLGKLELARTVAVDGAGEPARLSTGRSLPLASGAAVRLPPEKATVYLSARVRDGQRAAVFGIGAQDAATELAAVTGGRIGGVDVTPEGRWLLAAAVVAGQVSVLSAPADGRPGAVRTLTAAAGAGEDLAEVRIQP
jgi:hypothetical protein